jgi:hypothetical protein
MFKKMTPNLKSARLQGCRRTAALAMSMLTLLAGCAAAPP